MAIKPYFPIFLNLEQLPIVVIGGGSVALEKVEKLIPFSPRITLVAPILHPIMRELVENKSVNWIHDEYKSKYLTNARLVIAATPVEAINEKVFREASKRGIFANSVDDQKNCAFIFSANLVEGPIHVAISSTGTSPALAQKIRSRIKESIVTSQVGQLATYLGSKRESVKQALPTYQLRRKFWNVLLDSGIGLILEIRGEAAADREFHSLLIEAQKESVNLGKAHSNQALITLDESQSFEQEKEPAWSP